MMEGDLIVGYFILCVAILSGVGLAFSCLIEAIFYMTRNLKRRRRSFFSKKRKKIKI